jgi:hypothetical protein
MYCTERKKEKKKKRKKEKKKEKKEKKKSQTNIIPSVSMFVNSGNNRVEKDEQHTHRRILGAINGQPNQFLPSWVGNTAAGTPLPFVKPGPSLIRLFRLFRLFLLFPQMQIIQRTPSTTTTTTTTTCPQLQVVVQPLQVVHAHELSQNKSQTCVGNSDKVSTKNKVVIKSQTCVGNSDKVSTKNKVVNKSQTCVGNSDTLSTTNKLSTTCIRPHGTVQLTTTATAPPEGTAYRRGISDRRQETINGAFDAVAFAHCLFYALLHVLPMGGGGAAVFQGGENTRHIELGDDGDGVLEWFVEIIFF